MALTKPEPLLADWPLWRYWQVIKYPLLVGLALSALGGAAWWFYRLSWWWLQLSLLLALIVTVLILNYLAFKQSSGQLRPAVIGAGLYGFWMGLLLGVVNFWWQPAVWSFFYLIALILWQILLACLISLIAGYVYLHWWPGQRVRRAA